MNEKDKNKILIPGIFLLAFSVRSIVIFLAIKYNFIQTWEYEHIADNILKGLGYSFQHLNTTHYAYGPPLYPLLSATVYFFTDHSQLALLLIQALFSAMACVFVFKIGKEIFDWKIGMLASLMSIFHPAFVLYVTKLHSFNIDMPLFLVLFFVLLKAKSKISLKYFILLGIVYGLCLLSRSTIFFFLPAALVLLMFKSKDKRKLFRFFSFAFITAFLVISPWLLRNYMLFHKMVFIQKSGEVFWRGNNPNATGTSFTVNGKGMLSVAPKDFVQKINSATEIEQDALFWEDAANFIKSHPLKFISLTVTKFYYFWWFSPHSGIIYPGSYLAIYSILYSMCLIFAAMGILFVLAPNAAKLKEDVYLLILFSLIISLSQSFFYIEGRHRWVVEPFLLIFTANGIIGFKNRLAQCLRTKI